MALLFVYAINFKSILTFNYFINQTEIAELFCINKEKPKLDCNGKCHLATQIDKIDENTDDTPFSQQAVNYNFEINPIVIDGSFNSKVMLTESNKNQSFYISRGLSKGHYSILAPPPKVC